MLPRFVPDGSQSQGRQQIVMFSGAIISLVVAVLAAIVSYGGVPNATAAATAQHIGFVAIALFVISAMVTILDIELPDGMRNLFPRGDSDDLAKSANSDLRETGAL